MPSLAEQYRPREWSEVVGQDKAVAQLLRMRDGPGFAGQAIWISGHSGRGKTTLARLIAGELASGDWIEEYTGCSFGAPDIRHMRLTMRQRGLWGGGCGHAWIVNEAHGLRNDIMQRLDTFYERELARCSTAVLICTTTVVGQEQLWGKADFGPFLSRCIHIPLSARDLLKPFALRAQAIARAEGLDGKPLASYERLAKDCGNNLRRMLGCVQRGDMRA